MCEATNPVDAVFKMMSTDEVGTFVALVHGAALVHKTKSRQTGRLAVRAEPSPLRVDARVDGRRAGHVVAEERRRSPLAVVLERHGAEVDVVEVPVRDRVHSCMEV